MNKKFSFWPWALAWLLLAIISSYIRLYPLRAHMWDDSREQATMLVIYNIKQTLLQNILTQAPDMPPALANHLAEQKLNETLHTQNQKVQQAITQATAQLSRQPGAPPEKIYLLESDPYDFYNLTQNIVKTGRIAAIIKGSKYFNPLMVAPFGYWQPFTLHPYVGFCIYKIARWFDPHVPLMSAVAFTPLVVNLLVLAAFLWVCRSLGCSLSASFVGTLFMTLASIYLKRGSLGWYDTDPYNVLFPALLLGQLIMALRPGQTQGRVLWSAVFGITLGVYALFWQGWGLLFFLGLACALVCAGHHWLLGNNKPSGRQNFLFIPVFIALCCLLISLCFSFKDFFILFKEGFGQLTAFTSRGLGLWPDLFMTVGELKKSSSHDIFSSIGPVFLALGLGGWIYGLQRFLRDIRQEATSFLILSVFLAVSAVLALSAERFMLFLLVPLGLLMAVGLNRLFQFKFFRFWPAILLAGVALFTAHHDIRTVLTPIFNSTWDKALTAVKTETPTDSIINTWWPPGHFIKAMALRRVLFDGASLDEGAVGYWLANALLSQDENQARGLLRMLDLSGGTKAVDFLTKQCGLKTSDAVDLLKVIAAETKDQAQTSLQGILTDAQAKHLLQLTHDGQPHSYVMLYNEMVDDNLMLTFTAHWNIKKIEAINASSQLLHQVPKRNSPAFIDFLWAINGGPSKYSDALNLLGQDHHRLVFSQGLVVDLDTMEAHIQSPKFGIGKPLSVFYLKNGAVVEHKLTNGALNYSVVLYKEDGQYTARLMDRDLANSLIMKLYFFDGQGLKDFKPLVSVHDLTGRTRIKVFQILY